MVVSTPSGQDVWLSLAGTGQVERGQDVQPLSQALAASS